MADVTVTRPPYATFSSFRSLLGQLGESVLPHQIDRSLLTNKSGSDQSALIAALKWFELIDDSGRPTSQLKSLVQNSENDFAGLFRPLVQQSYVFMTDGSLNIENGTSKQLEQRFREYEISGSTLTKAISFFLSACKEAGIQVSPHFKAPSKPNGAPRRRTRKKEATEDGVADSNESNTATLEVPREGMVEIPIAIPNRQPGVILLPEGLEEDEWDYVTGMITFVIERYHKMAVGAKGKGTSNTQEGV